MSNSKSDAELVLTDRVRQDGMNKLSLMFTAFLMDNGMFTTCLNCAYWSDEEEICKYYKQRPPAKVIVVGCETHTDIPF